MHDATHARCAGRWWWSQSAPVRSLTTALLHCLRAVGRRARTARSHGPTGRPPLAVTRPGLLTTDTDTPPVRQVEGRRAGRLWRRQGPGHPTAQGARKPAHVGRSGRSKGTHRLDTATSAHCDGHPVVRGRRFDSGDQPGAARSRDGHTPSKPLPCGVIRPRPTWTGRPQETGQRRRSGRGRRTIPDEGTPDENAHRSPEVDKANDAPARRRWSLRRDDAQPARVTHNRETTARRRDTQAMPCTNRDRSHGRRGCTGRPRHTDRPASPALPGVTTAWLKPSTPTTTG